MRAGGAVSEGAHAHAAPKGLVWMSDDRPGIRRERKGDGFIYRDPSGRLLRRAGQINRIRALAIPPAYEDVWICPAENGHLQATGRDARGRKQYRYHPQWRAARDADKFLRMRDFGKALPKIRAKVDVLLAEPVGKVPHRDTVLATIVRLLDTTLVRIGNDEYARENHSYGLTTLRHRHASLEGSVVRLRFRGKGGISREVTLDDPRVAKVVRRCQAMPGQDLFQYEDERGECHVIGSDDVNAFLHLIVGESFTAKDFRTWHATSHALDLRVADEGLDAKERRSASQLLSEVAGRLGNTVAVCKKSYVHPRVLEAMATVAEARRKGLSTLAQQKRRAGLSAAERRLQAFLGRRG